jgi:hypothetical protein
MSSPQQSPLKPCSNYLTAKELAERWRHIVSLSTLDNWRSQGRGPRYFKAGGRVLYPLAEVINYEQRNMRGFPNTPTSRN